MSLVSAHRCRVLCRAAVLLLGVLCSRTAFAQEQVEYYGTDAIGSVRIVFDASGTVTGRMDYGPFGEALAPATGLDPHVYAQLFGDAEIGKAFAQARHYSSITGRFLRTDPVFSGLDDPQRWNRYAYALNGPLRYVDRAGTKTCEVDFCSGVEIDLPGGGGSSGGSGEVVMVVPPVFSPLGVIPVAVAAMGQLRPRRFCRRRPLTLRRPHQIRLSLRMSQPNRRTVVTARLRLSQA